MNLVWWIIIIIVVILLVVFLRKWIKRLIFIIILLVIFFGIFKIFFPSWADKIVNYAQNMFFKVNNFNNGNIYSVNEKVNNQENDNKNDENDIPSNDGEINKEEVGEIKRFPKMILFNYINSGYSVISGNELNSDSVQSGNSYKEVIQSINKYISENLDENTDILVTMEVGLDNVPKKIILQPQNKR